METQLKKDNGSPPEVQPSNPPAMPVSTSQSGASYGSFDPIAMNADVSMPMDGLLPTTNNFEPSPTMNMIPDIDLAIDENFSWEMIGLGLEEPLPTQDAVDELWVTDGQNRSMSANASTEQASTSRRSTLRVL